MRLASWLLLLALSLVLRPAAADAEVRGAAAETRIVSITGEPDESLRPPAPLPVAKAPAGARRTEAGGGAPRPLAPAPFARVPAAPLRDGLRAAAAADAVRPSCERLPYPPTGPPAR